MAGMFGQVEVVVGNISSTSDRIGEQGQRDKQG
jgi:hypothetical protein